MLLLKTPNVIERMSVNWTLVSKRMRPHGQLRKKLEQKIQKLEKHIEHFPPDAVHLHVQIEALPRKTSFDAALTLRLPSNILRAKKSGPDPVPAFDQAMKVLLREVSMFKAALRHESDWKRTAWRETAALNVPPSLVARGPAAVP
jgi:ribosomal subunit interface protein